jgi:hypothetical protein
VSAFSVTTRAVGHRQASPQRGTRGLRTSYFAHFFSDICSTERVPAMMLRHSMRLTPAISDKESPSSRIEPYIVTLPPVHGD